MRYIYSIYKSFMNKSKLINNLKRISKFVRFLRNRNHYSRKVHCLQLPKIMGYEQLLKFLNSILFINLSNCSNVSKNLDVLRVISYNATPYVFLDRNNTPFNGREYN